MTTRFWLLGTTDGVELAGSRLTQALGISLQAHESGYRGGAYLRGADPSVGEVIVQANFEDEEGYLAEADFPEFPVLIYLTQPDGSRSLDMLGSLGFQVLRVDDL